MGRRVCICGARGHVAAELIGLLDQHPHFDLIAVGSRSRAGELVHETVALRNSALRFQEISPEDVGTIDADVWVLGLPNGLSAPYVEAIQANHAEAKIIDLSSDHRDRDEWVYGLVEHQRSAISNATRVANPGCYATGVQLALLPIMDAIVHTPIVFGVSGYSGAGTTPSPKNDLHRLRDNLLPYRLDGHGHEEEISATLQRPVRLLPHVAPFFRGISLTFHAMLAPGWSADRIFGCLEEAYREEALVQVHRSIPEIRDVVFRHHVAIGGVSVQEGTQQLTLVATLDNLRKGAATQALQNLNLMCGFEEREAIAP